MDHFALPDDELVLAQQAGTMYRNFQGYSTRGYLDLVGLGVSSIGKVGDNYIQNQKTLPEYYGAIDRGVLPVHRGYTMTRDDVIRRLATSSEPAGCRSPSWRRVARPRTDRHVDRASAPCRSSGRARRRRDAHATTTATSTKDA
jgi:hypothetical protein